MPTETKDLGVNITAVPIEQKVVMIEKALEHLLNALLIPIGNLKPGLRGEIKEAMALLKVPPQE